MSKAMSILGSVLFFVAAPMVVAGLVPWWIMRWEFQSAFLGFEVTRVIGVILIMAGTALISWSEKVKPRPTPTQALSQPRQPL